MLYFILCLHTSCLMFEKEYVTIDLNCSLDLLVIYKICVEEHV